MKNPGQIPQAAPQAQAGAHPLTLLLELSRSSRRAGSASELRFLAVNASHSLAPYRQAALWFQGLGVQALSGIVQVEANAPYALWLAKTCTHLAGLGAQPARVHAQDLPAALAQEWDQWCPEHGLWLPLAGQAAQPSGGLLLLRDQPWQDQDIALLAEWMDAWQLAWRAHFRPSAWGLWRRRLLGLAAPREGRRWWPLAWLGALVLVLAWPVRLTVLAPGELVPATPAIIRSPLDGVVGVVHVQPNQLVRAGQPLFGFDEALIQSRLEVARQALATAEAEYRQTIQLALGEARSRSQLSLLTGKIEEKRAEARYLEEQLQRARVLAPREGIALLDDPGQWVGRPVSVGERIMRIAAPDDVEIEAWVNVADAIALDSQAEVSLFLAASPLSPVRARLRYFSHEAVQRPDGSYAYRLRARLEEASTHRVGLKGTAKIHGEQAPLAYWLLRRPWAWLRTLVGW